MARWFFEPGHTAAEFRVRHMMVTWVRGHFKDVHGSIEYDPANPRTGTVEAVIDADKIWTGQPQRDAHLRSPDFLDVESYPEIRFRGSVARLYGENDFEVVGDLSIRGTTRPVLLDVHRLGHWKTPWWEGGRDLGPRVRAGFVGTTRIDRRDFGVSWNDAMEQGGQVVGPYVFITLDIEAVRED